MFNVFDNAPGQVLVDGPPVEGYGERVSELVTMVTEVSIHFLYTSEPAAHTTLPMPGSAFIPFTMHRHPLDSEDRDQILFHVYDYIKIINLTGRS